MGYFMNFDHFVFTKKNNNYTVSLLDYLQLVQSASQYDAVKDLEYQSRKVDVNGVEDISTPDIYIEREHKIHVFTEVNTPYEAAYSFTGAGNFLYFISAYPENNRVITQMQFLRNMYDKLYSCMGVDHPFADNRQSSYKVILKELDDEIKLFHYLNYDTGFEAVFDQSFNIIDVYYKHKSLEKFRHRSLDDKKVIFAFFNVYFRSSLLREQLHEQLGKSYEALSFEEIRDFLTIYRMASI